MKLNGINWLFKKPKQKEPIKKCLTCPNIAKSRRAKYCLNCINKRMIANGSKQSLRRYHKNKGI